MTQHTIEAPTGVLAEFAARLEYDDLPAIVALEAKRAILDSTGCALAGSGVAKGQIAVDLARHLGGNPQAAILGTKDRLSVAGAAFANGELMNAMDFDTILVPGHVSAFTIPATLAMAERRDASGRDFITAVALAHEVSARVGASLRGFREGKTYPPPKFGLGACVFGAAAGAGKVIGFDAATAATCFGLAGAITPIPIGAKSISLPYTPMYKYSPSGWINQCGVTGALLAERGYVGDTTILDGELGFWTMYGSDVSRWERITGRLGQEWLMMNMQYKPYPVAGSVMPMVEAFCRVMEENRLRADDIEKVVIFGEPLMQRPALSERGLRSHMDTQFKPFYGVAMIAYGVRVCEWQDRDVMRDPRITGFTEKVSFQPFAKFDESRKQEFALGMSYVVKKPAAAEVTAGGRVYRAEVELPRWGPSGVPELRTSDDDLIAKFRVNASRVLPPVRIEEAIRFIMGLEKQSSIRGLTALLSS